MTRSTGAGVVASSADEAAQNDGGDKLSDWEAMQ